MESNFNEKLEEIEKMLGAWFLRYLTPYGKITVIKSLAMSKLSHIALVIPSLNKTMVKGVEKILYNFLWNKKSDKVKREL